MFKQCSKCGEDKSYSEFYAQKGRSDGLRSQCKHCHVRGIATTRNLEFRRRADTRAKKKAYHTSIEYKLRHLLRTRLNMAIRIDQKSGSAIRDLGCSMVSFKQYLEQSFQIGMSWENHGEWHIDHIVPLSAFDLSDREQFLKACHFTNMQPLWAADNLKKSDHHE